MGLHLHPLQTKIIGELEFVLESPLHIGAGGEEVRRSFLRLPTEELVIPSSTWKGAFRSLSEQLAKSANFSGLVGLAVEVYNEEAGGISYRPPPSFVEEIVEVVRGNTSANIPHKPEEFLSIVKELGYTDDEITEVKTAGLGAKVARRIAEDYLAIHCPIGSLYGNRVLAGKIRFVDSLLKSTTEIRPGVGIDRKSGKAETGILHFTEVISKGTKITLRLVADNIIQGQYDSRLFASTLKAIKELGLSIGARKSTGLGNLTLKDAKFYLVDLRKDEKLAIGNPFKRGNILNLLEFIEWITKPKTT